MLGNGRVSASRLNYLRFVPPSNRGPLRGLTAAEEERNPDVIQRGHPGQRDPLRRRGRRRGGHACL